MKSLLVFVCLVFVLSACRGIEFEDTWMDSPATVDPNVDNPQALVSQRIENPTDEQLATPVLILGHGWSSSSHEWDEFFDSIEGRDDVLASRVVLGGHGRNSEAWGEATWESWRTPLLEEYENLRAKGYSEIYFVATSTSNTLLMKSISEGYFDDDAPEGIYMVAPLVVAVNKDIYACGAFGWIAGSAEINTNEEEKLLFYTNIPISQVCEIAEIASEVEHLLKNEGIDVPANTRIRARRGDNDDTVDAVSKGFIEQGLNASDFEFDEVVSDFHIFTRLDARLGDFSEADVLVQQDTFEDILNFAGVPAN